MIIQRLGAEEGDTPVEQQPAAMQDFDPTYDRCGSFFILDPPSTRLLSVCCSFNSGRQCDETAPTLRAKAALGGQLSANAPPVGAPIHARSRAPESIRGNRLMNVIDQAPQRVWRSSRRGRSSVPSHQVAVARRKAAPQASLHVICANALHPILDAPWHHVLVAREEVHAPDRIVCVVLLNVGELQTHVARCGDDDSAPETR